MDTMEPSSLMVKQEVEKLTPSWVLNNTWNEEALIKEQLRK